MNTSARASQSESGTAVRTFRDFAFRLEASLAAVRTDPSAANVRHLRAGCRHVSAQLELFKLSDSPSSRKVDTKGLKHLLKKLAMVSGRVRRIDAQAELLKSASSLKIDKSDCPISKAAYKPAFDSLVKREGQRLYGRLKRKRKLEMEELRESLKFLQKPLTKRLTRLMILLDDEPPAHLTDSLLYQLISKWFRNKVGRRNILRASTRELHTIRKAAKRARYMAEISENPRLRGLAAILKKIQNTGGTWHDTLELHRSAGRESGKHSALSKSLYQSKKASDRDYRKRIAEFRSLP
jgi:CHAD domain-containing protein